MHKIDRYGVIALVFMAVTFLAVYFWDDRESDKPSSSPADRARSARVEPRPDSKPPAPAHKETAAPRGGSLPLASTGGEAALKDGARLAGSDRGAPERRVVPRPLPEVRDDGTTKADERALASERTAAPDADELGARIASAPEKAPDPGVRLASDASAPGRTDAERAAEREPRDAEVTPAPSTPSAKARTYTVRAGDSLENIAERELGDPSRWKEIQTLNGIADPRRLWVGKVLTLPGGGAPARAPSEVAATPAQKPGTGATPAASGRTYVVQKGDILGVIAQKELGSAKAWTRIAALNPSIDPDHLVPGMKLVLPAGTAPRGGDVPLELATGRSRSVARAPETKSEGAFKVR